MPALTISQLRDHAEAALNEAESRLAQLRTERDNINAAIRETVAERDEAKSVVAKLTPRKPKAQPAPEPVEVEVEPEEVEE